MREADCADLAAIENEPLRRDVRLLGDLLGETIKQQYGDSLFDLVEEVRSIAKQARLGEIEATRQIGRASCRERV